MLGAGVTLVRALTILAQEETRKKKEREILTQVLKLVRQGMAVSAAMEKQSGAFPLLMIHMYRAAETSGNLADTAKRLAVHYEKEHQLNSKVSSATTYPKILCVLSVLVVIFIMSVILPQLSSLFDSLTELPLPTRILFGISSFVQNYFVLLVLVIVIAAVVLVLMGQMPAVKRKRDEWKLKLPIVGKLLGVVYTARFSRCLSSLYVAGIPIVNALQIVKRTIGNAYIESQFDTCISLLREGRSLSEAVSSIRGLRKKLSSVIRIGEESGDLAMMLDSLADSFDYESEMAVNRLISYLEPVLIVIMAVIIGFIMVAVMLPIYSSYSAIGANVYY
jgi:type IV pilus assembly protein PilC